MKLIDALRVSNAAQQSGLPDETLHLVCGFTPLHLGTFLTAHLQRRSPRTRIVLETGLFGDVSGTLAQCARTPASGAAVALEWSDLDPRLGWRAVGGWAPAALPDIVETARARLAHLVDAIGAVAAATPVAVSFPTLPLPPVAFTTGWQASEAELALRAAVADAAARLAGQPRVRVVNPQRLDALSPPAARGDARADLATGFPYQQVHAERLALALTELLRPEAPKKGLITDLDDTLWRGILGEVGVDGIACTLDRHAQVHGLYQQLLASLAESGVLVAIASKNDPALVERALAREEHVLRPGHVFPVVAHWKAKSESVRVILESWNVGADAVVFVDDSPMELAEVQEQHPDVTCLQFPRDDAAAVVALLARLRDLFGRPALREEDRLRLDSLRSAAAMRLAGAGAAGAAGASEEFLARADAEVTLDFGKDAADGRPLELVNKTNQFNLNGRRFTEAEWLAHLAGEGTFLLTASYRDKFGPLGKVAVVTGTAAADGVVAVTGWVMSCRAFARRLEHQCLRALFERFQAGEVVLAFSPTERNGPTREFLAEFFGPEPWPAELRLTRETFEARCRPTYHTVRTPGVHASSHG